MEAQAESQLQEERSKSATLLRPLEGAPVKTELSLLRDNQQLGIKLQRTEEDVKVRCLWFLPVWDQVIYREIIYGLFLLFKALREQVEQLEEAQLKANNRVSNHKEATQLLQTELQDSRAQVEEKEEAIQTLTCKLRESQVNQRSRSRLLETHTGRLLQ